MSDQVRMIEQRRRVARDYARENERKAREATQEFWVEAYTENAQAWRLIERNAQGKLDKFYALTR